MTASLAAHPGLWLAAAGFAAFFARGPLRSAIVLAAPLAALALLWLLPEGSHASVAFLGHELSPLRADRLARVFATVFALAAFAGALYAIRQPSRLEVPAALVYAGAAIGAVLAGDLITLFVCWEAMAIGSMLVLWSAGPAAAPAARRYILVHLLGGMLLMAGIAGHVSDTGSIAFTAMRADDIAHALILAGFLVNVAAPPFSPWLPDAYPEASWSGMVFLSAFTTKAAVYVLLRGFPGTEILVPVGLFMVFYGIAYAILSSDLRRILAYSIVSQVGFMVAAAGIGTEMAINGAAAHAFAHIVYKALLLMAAGAVLLQAGQRDCAALGGLARSMPFTTACFLVGAVSISAFPLTSGFVSKSMIAQAAAAEHLGLAWMLLNVASAGTFLYVGLRLPWLVFFGRDSGLRPADPPATMRWAMLLLAFLCIALGVMPGALYGMLPHAVDYAPYTAGHIVAQLQLLLAAGLAFLLLRGWLGARGMVTRDIDWLYRQAGPALGGLIASGWGAAGALAASRLAGPGRLARSLLQRLAGPTGFFSRPWSTRAMVLYVAAFLLAFLLIPYR